MHNNIGQLLLSKYMTQATVDMGRGIIARMIGKSSCIHFFIIYFRQINKKKNEIIKNQ
jgi:hypothetical protein